ncbi:hypothetical protein N9Q86_02330 [Porticoccaceae bacterium]|nr:hypothetical protein [Porticoccaceae bacterium]
MAKFSIHEEFNNLDTSASALNSKLKLIDYNLKQKNNVDKECDSLAEAFEKALTRESINDFPFNEVRKYIDETSIFSKNVINFYKWSLEHDYINVCKEKSSRRAERNDYWKLWSQRVLRALVSVGILVLAYSSLVWLSERYSFVKIPIRDLLANSLQLH